tara:strand:- start:1445 stop:1672 length:228 start_codon:yes stop_codon:yes gene_type:complete
MEQLTTKKLKKKKVKELVAIADQMATRLQWLHSTGKHNSDPDMYKRLALEIYHISEIIDEKLRAKKLKPRVDYGK